MVYLNLYHGRHSREEELDDWGFDGPILGPFPSIQITYGSHIKTTTKVDLGIDSDGLVEFFGAYYGDFSIESGNTTDSLAKEDFEDRLKDTQRILATKNTDLPLLINEKEEWVKIYIEERLKHGSHTEQSRPPRRQSHRRPSPRRRESSKGMPAR